MTDPNPPLQLSVSQSSYNHLFSLLSSCASNLSHAHLNPTKPWSCSFLLPLLMTSFFQLLLNNLLDFCCVDCKYQMNVCVFLLLLSLTMSEESEEIIDLNSLLFSVHCTVDNISNNQLIKCTYTFKTPSNTDAMMTLVRFNLK